MPRGLVVTLRVLLIAIGTIVLLLGAATSVLVGPTTPPRAGRTTSSRLASRSSPSRKCCDTSGRRCTSRWSARTALRCSWAWPARSTRQATWATRAGDWSPVCSCPGASRRTRPGLAQTRSRTRGSRPGGSPRSRAPARKSWSGPCRHGRYSIVVLNADGAPAVDVQVTLGLELEGTFYAALAVAALGLALVLLGLWLWIRARRRRPADPTYGRPGRPRRAAA